MTILYLSYSEKNLILKINNLLNEDFQIFSPCLMSVVFRPDVDDVHFVLDQHAKLDFHSSVKQESVGTHVAPLIALISLILHAQQRSRK